MFPESWPLPEKVTGVPLTVTIWVGTVSELPLTEAFTVSPENPKLLINTRSAPVEELEIVIWYVKLPLGVQLSFTL